MEELLYRNFRATIDITPEQFRLVEKALIRREIKKKSYLLREGMECTYNAFVSKGCLRAYSIDEGGAEHVIQFALENYWIADIFSFLKGGPAVVNIDAIEDSRVLLLESDRLEVLYRTIPSLERYFRILYQNAFLHLQRRVNASLSVSAADRYIRLIGQQPAIGARIPLIHIASYLGITPESLSRIRRNLKKG